MNTKREYILVQWPDRPRPSLMQTEDRHRLYWGDGPSHCYMTSKMTILKSFGWLDSYKDYDAIEAIEFELEENYPPVTGLKDSPGWLSPEGVYYPCDEAEHDSTAMSITAILYRNWDAGPYLEDHRWLRVSNGYIVPDTEPTQRQLNAIFDLSQIATGKLKQTLEWELNDFTKS